MDGINIALLGFGNVGKGVWNIIQMNRDKIERYIDKPIHIKKILVRDINKDRGVDVPGQVFTQKFEDIINDEEIDIVVELVGGIDGAYQYIKSALLKGKNVVTANKAVIATKGEELRQLAKQQGVNLRYEASVAGGIPVINNITRSLSANKIDSIMGIINGTTNYILTQMGDNGMDFDEALKLAQQKGYAEADPTSDIEGEDAAFKLSILIYIVFGLTLSPDEIPREGITKVTQKDIEYAGQIGYKVKLLATARRKGDDFIYYVHPALVPEKHPLASVNDEYNALFIHGNAVGDLMLLGKGAGSMPTGSAVMGDILDISKRMGTSYRSGNLNLVDKNGLNTIGEGKSKYYLRVMVEDKPGQLGKIASTFGKYGISLESVSQRAKGEDLVPLIFITYGVERSILDKALNEILENDIVQKVACILKVENI
ncbi:MAG: homoserine dehydrogenase [Clostridia bacterium]|nr:homoserine dehydrogenase [Clostridia bacterium]